MHWVIVRLLNESKFFSLRLAKTALPSTSPMPVSATLCHVYTGAWSHSASVTLQNARNLTYGKGIGENFLLSSQWTVAV
jgi:hypothetical protein